MMALRKMAAPIFFHEPRLIDIVSGDWLSAFSFNGVSMVEFSDTANCPQ